MKQTHYDVDGNAIIYNTEEFKPDFSKSRKKELDGLFSSNVFRKIRKSEVANGARIYGLRFVDEVKKDIYGSLYEKSRLVAQNYMDNGAKGIPTKAPTITRMAQRATFCIIPMRPKRNVYTRDVTQAYTQSGSELERMVYLEPVAEMGLDEDIFLVAVKPLYGIPEAGLHWYITYSNHNITELEMQRATFDGCLFFKIEETDTIPNITILQVDDSIGSGTEEFLKLEEEKSARFETKPRKIINIGDEIWFNGSLARHEKMVNITLRQAERPYYSNIK